MPPSSDPPPRPAPPSGSPADVDPELVVVHGRTVACDGGDGPLGHPLVYFPVAAEGEVCCPYCSRRFRYLPGPGGETEPH